MYDVAIIGSGPAGLEAALTLKNRNKSFIIFGDTKLSEKVYKAHEVKNYLGLPNIKGEDFMNAFLNHIKVMDINITDDHIKQIYDLADIAVICKMPGHSGIYWNEYADSLATGKIKI